MKLVEIIPGLATSPATLDTTLALARAMGKECTVSKDMPGFIANRILMPYINEATFVLQDGIASREHIDATMKWVMLLFDCHAVRILVVLMLMQH
jgi:3-hydroxybutyryl-CoA dehydrogenase